MLWNKFAPADYVYLLCLLHVSLFADADRDSQWSLKIENE